VRQMPPAATRHGRAVPVKELEAALTRVASQYPAGHRQHQLQDVRRIAFNIQLALDGREPSSVSVCDLGGGIGLFSVGCAAIGCKQVTLVDDFQDEVNTRSGDSILDLHRSYGVSVVRRDVIADGLGGLAGETFNTFTSFDSMEHWHHSPKRLFKEVAATLCPGGVFVLGVPNCVNLRKRLTVPFGFGKWSSMNDWYEKESFRGHVREPDVQDLLYIVRDMELTDIKIYGRNWLGHASPSRLIRICTAVADAVLRLRVSLCSDIYVTGKRAGNPA
jgi:SAM-dependent methyltransferase